MLYNHGTWVLGFRAYIKLMAWLNLSSLIAQLVKNPPAMQEILGQEDPFNSWVRKIPWRRDRLPPPVFLGFPCGSAGKEFACNAGDLGSIPGLGKSPREGKGYSLQYSGLENSMDCILQGITKSISWEMPGWMKHKLESRLPGEISRNSDMQMTPPLWQKEKRN